MKNGQQGMLQEFVAAMRKDLSHPDGLTMSRIMRAMGTAKKLAFHATGGNTYICDAEEK